MTATAPLPVAHPLLHSEALVAPPARVDAFLTNAMGQARTGDYAVFDADNTLWASDIEEAGIAFFEQQGWLSLDGLAQELKPLPPRSGETLYGYYQRLCDFDEKLCLPWSAQVFSGQPLGLLKQRIDALFAWQRPIEVRYMKGGHEVTATIRAPRIYPLQRELVRSLHRRGVAVFVVSASHEELVRMVVSDPRYGLDIPPERVIGTTTLLRGPEGTASTARGDIAHGLNRREGYWRSRDALVPSATLWSPLPWQEGKVAAIQAYIDPVRRPALVAGDSANDFAMLFYSGGTRLWVARSPSATTRLREARAKRVDPDASTENVKDGWIEVKPVALGGEPTP